MYLGKSLLCGMAMAVAFGCAAAHAQYRPAVIDVNNEFGIAADAFLQSYTERYNRTTPDSEYGVIPGVQAKATGMFDLYGVSNIYTGLHFQYDRGAVDYNGAYLFSGTPLHASTVYTTTDVGVELGKGFLLSESVLITPLVEGGWHDWNRSLSHSQVEDYTNDYIGGGMRGDLAITGQLVLTGKVAAGATIDPNMNATSAGLPHMTFSLGMKPFYQADLGLDYKFTAFYGPMHVYGGVDFTHFDYGRSAVNSLGFLEPLSISNDATFHLGFAVGL